MNTDDELESLLQSGFRYACSLTHQPAEAEDLVQEAWLKLANSKHADWNKPLFFTTLRHLFIDRYRRNRLVIMDSLDESSTESLVTDGSSIEQANEHEVAMDIHLLENSLSALRVEEREAIYLHLVEGYTAAEVAELTDRSRNTVLSLIHRGRHKLVDAMNAESAESADVSDTNISHTITAHDKQGG